MFDQSLRFLSFGRMIRGGGSHRTSSSTWRFWGPGARSQAKGPVLQAAPPGLVFSKAPPPYLVPPSYLVPPHI